MRARRRDGDDVVSRGFRATASARSWSRSPKRVAARGHEVHVVAPWHPLDHARPRRGRRPLPLLQVRAGAGAERLRLRAGAARGRAGCAARRGRPRRWRWRPGWFKAHARRAEAPRDGHARPLGRPRRRDRRVRARPALPLVVSLHGSDVFVAERVAPARRRGAAACSTAPAAVTACSADLAQRARSRSAPTPRSHRGRAVRRRHGAVPARSASARGALRAQLGIAAGAPLVFTAGRLVRKKGFEYLIDALPRSMRRTGRVLAIAGDGDLARRAARARAAPRASPTASAFSAICRRTRSAALVRGGRRRRSCRRSATTAATSTACRTPSSRRWRRARRSSPRRPAASASVVEDGGPGLIVPERDAGARWPRPSRGCSRDPARRSALGRPARALVEARFGWDAVGRALRGGLRSRPCLQLTRADKI